MKFRIFSIYYLLIFDFYHDLEIWVCLLRTGISHISLNVNFTKEIYLDYLIIISVLPTVYDYIMKLNCY